MQRHLSTGQTNMRRRWAICPIAGLIAVLACAAVGPQSANAQGEARRISATQGLCDERTHHFEFKDASFHVVCDWLVDISQLPMIGSARPGGNFSFQPEIGPHGIPRRYTVTEIIDELNQSLMQGPTLKSAIVRRPGSLAIYPADEPLPEEVVKRVHMSEIYSRSLAKTEFVKMRYQLTRPYSDDLARDIKRFMSPMGLVVPMEHVNQLVLIDTVESLRMLIHRIEELASRPRG